MHLLDIQGITTISLKIAPTMVAEVDSGRTAFWLAEQRTNQSQRWNFIKVARLWRWWMFIWFSNSTDLCHDWFTICWGKFSELWLVAGLANQKRHLTLKTLKAYRKRSFEFFRQSIFWWKKRQINIPWY